MRRAYSALIFVFGAVCAVIGLAHVAFGPAIVPGSIPVNATLDSEDRFYATLFVGFGLALIWCSRQLALRAREFGFLLAIFFAGGLARIVSLLMAGPPHPLFLFLGALELLMPPLLWFGFRRHFGAGAGNDSARSSR